jgi:hypothetical protein
MTKYRIQYKQGSEKIWTTWIDRNSRRSAKTWAREQLPPESRLVAVTATTDAGKVIHPVGHLLSRLAILCRLRTTKP